MKEKYQAFHNLYHTSCSMRAELDRLLWMAEAYPHFQQILAEHYDAAVDTNMVHALHAAKGYESARAFPPRHVAEQLYVAAVQMLDKLDRIEHYRQATVELARCSATMSTERQLGRLVEDFNVNIGEVNVPAREAIEAIRGYLPPNEKSLEVRDRQAPAATISGGREHASI